jgi:conjugative transfer signal peptidase TraF
MTDRPGAAADTPLFAWGAELRASRERRRRLRRRTAGIAIGIACLATTIMLPPRPLLVWNASASAPMGLYRVGATDLAPGDMVIARLPDGVRDLAARRHYLPANVPLVKRVAAAPGDRVCALGEEISVNGRRIAGRFAQDARGRPMPWWRGCVTLRRGALFLLMDHPGSFDGRYFGPTSAHDIIGRAHPLWVR